MDTKVEVPGRGPACPALTLAGHADARSFSHSRGNSHVHGSRVAVVLDRKAPHGAAIGVFQREVDGLLHVASVAAALTAGPAAAAARCFVLGRFAGKERSEEVGERILVAEQISHLISGHGAITAALSAAEVAGPLAGVKGGTAWCGAAGALRLLVHLPVRPKLVV